MLVSGERGKPGYPGKNLSEQSREPTNATQISQWVSESNQHHIGGMRVLWQLHQPLGGKNHWKYKWTGNSPKVWKKKWLHKSQLKVIKSSYQDTSACFALCMVKMSSCVDAKVDNFLSLFENRFSNQYGPKKCWVNHRNEGIDCCTLRISEKQSWTVETVGHSKNDYRKRPTQLQRDWLCGEIKGKWKKKEIHKHRSKCFTLSC